MLAGGVILFALLASAAWFVAQSIGREPKRLDLAEYQVGDPRLPKIYNEGE